ncbi:DNA-binding domain-containing protein [Rhizobiaceae bacterium n13]|uniref:DNA-binding domain-containing protein n=1 Tax=Ferirhizobium litorale TaxID=2927786 RepID=A0AAE3TZM4_9HYPH|nr:DNA-binding domain-containing protein [Fererhizobium litorale]MDI7860997.1 DNA-binding domain-containing protein [Fererhizobium litorale]MDI7921144.1 DNA-binding domain-containing protein [Fererhizobium litorale]
MSTETQTRFAAALQDGTLPIPAGLNSWNAGRPERRFGVYRNNVAVGLIGALASRFPATERIVGEEFFAAMAREFIRHHPPRSPLLLSYGDDFGNFAKAFEPARALAYLPDIIRLEIARGHAYHAADAQPMAGDVLAAVDPSRLAGLTFVMHPSASVVRSPHPVVTIWAMNAGEMEIAPIAGLAGEDALIVRPQMNVEVHRLPPGGAVFLEALQTGSTLAAAVESASADSADFNLSANIAGALGAGAFAAVHQPPAGD